MEVVKKKKNNDLRLCSFATVREVKKHFEVARYPVLQPWQGL